MSRLACRRASVAARLVAAAIVACAGVGVTGTAGAAPLAASAAVPTAPAAVPTGAPGTVVPVPPGMAVLVSTTTSTTGPASWSGGNYVSSASGAVSTGGTATTTTPPAAPSTPLKAVPAGLGPIDHRDLVAEGLLGALVAGAIGALTASSGRRRAGRRLRTGSLTMAALTASAAMVPLVPSGAAGAAPAAPVFASTATAVLTTAVPAATTVAAGPGPEAGVGQPLEVRIPALGVDAPVAASEVDASGALEVPRAPTTVGWWAGGPVPGAASGTAVLASHVDYGRTPGAFAHLVAIRPGQLVTVTGAQGSETFQVAAVTAYPKATLPWTSLFTAAGPGSLTLVTCGGAFDRDTGHYSDNVVVTAVPVSPG